MQAYIALYVNVIKGMHTLFNLTDSQPVPRQRRGTSQRQQGTEREQAQAAQEDNTACE